MRAAAKRAWLGALCVAALALGAAAPAQAAFDDPLFIFRPVPPPPPNSLPLPPPATQLEGPCGLALDAAGNIYVSDYYHHAVDVFIPNPPSSYGWGYITQIPNEDPVDGPCGLAFDSAGNLYVNNFHRNVVKFAPEPNFGPGTVFAGVGAEVEPQHPTGVAVSPVDDHVYVNNRTNVGIHLPSGAGIGQIGVGTLADAYGVAVSGYAATKGFVYVPDAGDNTVKVYDPATSSPTDPPLATISGAGTPAGHFTSLRNSAIAVDNETGEVYVVDDLTPRYTSHHEGIVYVFSAAGVYEGRLKYSVDVAQPAGLAVDNFAASTKGRVYVTSGNSERAAIYAYPPHAVTSSGVPLPSTVPGGGDSGSAVADPVVSASPQTAPAPAAASPASTSAESPTVERPSQKASKRRMVKKRHRADARHRPARNSRGASR